jgi:phosphoribosylformimino-5-aminoimidazole carboxamide ribotide isomerase
MLVIPAVDIKGERCVRLFQGRAEKETVYGEDPALMAQKWVSEGAEFLHVVDLDGAFEGYPKNWETVQKIISSVNIPIELGGGIRSPEMVEKLLSCGVTRVIIGSKAVDSPDFLEYIFREFRERIVPSIDARDGIVLVKGWEESTDLKAIDLGITLKKIGFNLIIYTDTAVDGTLKGPNLPAIEEFLDQTGLGTIAAGGVSRLEDIVNLKRLERKGLVGTITGKAIYEGTLNLAEAIRAGR